jgi:catecholate siderophore receptor
VFDAMAAYDVSDRVAVQLNVQNITGEFHLASVNNGGTRYMRGTPRTILLSGTVQFY